MTQLDLIHHIAIGRPNDKTGQHEVLCSYSTRADDPQQDNYTQSTMKVLAKSKKIEIGKRLRLVSESFDIHVQAEQATDGTVFLLIVFTDPEFGVHHNVNTFYQEFANQTAAAVPKSEWGAAKPKLTQRLSTLLTSIQKKYNSSALLDANNKVTQVKGVMDENIKSALLNHEKIEDLDAKSQQIEEDSLKFKNRAEKVKCRFIKQRIKVIALLALVICVVIAIIVIAVVVTKKKKD